MLSVLDGYLEFVLGPSKFLTEAIIGFSTEVYEGGNFPLIL